MNILPEGTDYHAARTHTNVDRGTTSYCTPDSVTKSEKSGFALDISGTVMDNSAYTGHGQTAEEVMLEAGQMDITTRRNYMAVMSNSMSDEDFARLQREGVHPGSTDIETVVTIVDHIKTALMKGGTEVIGYTDTMDRETLKEIAGSETFARELEKQFAEHDLPITQENVTSVVEAWNKLSQADYPTDGSVKYMVENSLAPTSENFYTAKYSAAADASKQGRGYYADGEVAGYYAKKPETVDCEKLLPQMEKLIEEAGYVATTENLQDARWLVEKGIPLNADTFSLLRDIKGLQFPVSEQEFLRAVTCALSDGISPAKADLSKTESNHEKAAVLIEQTESIQNEAVDIILAKELPLTLKNLLAAQNEFLKGGQSREQEASAVNVQGRRLLEEVRLSMTVEANLRLLRRGYQIETAPLEQLVEKLKEAENDCAKALTGETDEARAQQKSTLYKETLDVLREIKSSPEEVLSDVSYRSTLREVSVAGAARAAAYQRAGLSYETLMTAPRKDMGDSIKKAFQNVDDILADLDLELSDKNRRAVRILGYNNIGITEEHIKKIAEMDELLTGVIREMKPGKVLQMIREDVNPLNMPLDELEEYLRQQEDSAQEMENYSKFLYKLEQQKGISKEEKSAYIGIYRLVRQIERADDASVGALWQTGAAYTLENLLGMVRSSKHKAMDYTIDDSFAGAFVKDTGAENIISQILQGFEANTFSNSLTGEMNRFLEQAGDEEAGREYDRMLNEQIRTAVSSEDAVLRQLSSYEQPVTADNLLLAAAMLKSPREIWQQTGKFKEKLQDSSSLAEAGQKLVEAFEGREEAQNAYDSFREEIHTMLEEQGVSEENTSLDVKAMSMLHKQITFLSRMAREENYEIPLEINGSLTSVNLKIVHHSNEESKVSIAMDTDSLGKIAAEFHLSQQGLDGFCICSTKEGTNLLNNEKLLWEEKLQKEEIRPGEIYFAAGENLELVDFSLRQSADRQQGQDAGILYRAARAFIGYIQETGIKKGNEEYEN